VRAEHGGSRGTGSVELRLAGARYKKSLGIYSWGGKKAGCLERVKKLRGNVEKGPENRV